MIRASRLRRRRDRRSGQALVEFALVVPFLLLLILGIVDFARAWNVYQMLTDAAREGAREAVVDNGKTEAQVKTIVIDYTARAAITLTTADITITGMSDGRGEPTTVRIEYDYYMKWVGGFMGILTGSRTVEMVTEFVMRNE
jgi:Flp pilus assembly protein TadG